MDEHGSTSARSTKRQRMDHLIQMSRNFAGVNEAPPPTQTDDARGGHQSRSIASLAANDQHTTAESAKQTSTTHTGCVARKKTWTNQEDAVLQELVARLGRDWAAIAAHFPTRDRKRVRERFVNHVDPALAKAPWSEDDDHQLRQLQQEIGSCWARIAKELSSRRSPDDVKNRWFQLSSSNEDGLTSKRPPQRWTRAEADTLRSLVEANGAQDWFFIASQIPGRTDIQCRQHWHRVLAPSIVKGHKTWSMEEDNLLRAKVDELGHQWEEIAQFLPGRLGKQCRERYINQLHPSVIMTPWAATEDATLCEAHRRHPSKWSVIARELPGRSENAVKNRWNALKRKTTE